MSSLFGGKTSSSSTTTTTPYTGVYANQIGDFYNTLQSKYSTGATPYTGQLNYGTTSNFTNSLNNFSNAANNNVLNQYASGAFIDPTTNPYAMSGYNLGTQALMDQFGKIDNSIKGNFNKSGAFNSSMRTATQMKNATDTKKSLSDFGQQYFGNLYNTGVSNFLNANQQQQSNFNNLFSAAKSEQQLGQDSLDRQYKDWLYQQGVNDQNIQNLLQYFSLVKNPSQTTESTQKTSGLFG